jgi:hypothetical protein
MVEGTNPEELVSDIDGEEMAGSMDAMGGGESTQESGGMSGNLGGLFNSDPHEPIDEYSGVSFSFEDGSKYLERGIDKLSGWPAILDLGIGTTMMVMSKVKGPSENDSEDTEENPEDIDERIRQEAGVEN